MAYGNVPLRWPADLENGHIRRWLVKENDAVLAGQTLAICDPLSYSLNAPESGYVISMCKAGAVKPSYGFDCNVVETHKQVIDLHP